MLRFIPSQEIPYIISTSHYAGTIKSLFVDMRNCGWSLTKGTLLSNVGESVPCICLTHTTGKTAKLLLPESFPYQIGQYGASPEEDTPDLYVTVEEGCLTIVFYDLMRDAVHNTIDFDWYQTHFWVYITRDYTTYFPLSLL